MKLFNTLSRRIEPFVAQHPPEVQFYACGPTVYQFAHIGNLRAYIAEDILRRALEFNGFSVRHVMNITDVGHLASDRDTGDDKIEKAANSEKKSAKELTIFYATAFKQNLLDLNILLPLRFLKATDHIPEQVELISALEKKGVVYQTSDGMYFDTSKFPQYHVLARLNQKGLQEGIRVEKNPEKKNPTDFALWKFSPRGKQRQQEWNSPWGIGFPGWHIECSAMAMTALSPTLDIHTGGIDLIPVHHTNEIAQSESATGKPFSRFWFHVEHLRIGHGRMGKSEGNSITLSDIQNKEFDPLAFRLFCLTAHYRSPIQFSWEALESSQDSLKKLYARLQEMNGNEHENPDPKLLKEFADCMDNDLNTSQALAVFWKIVKSDIPDARKKATLYACDSILGLSLSKPKLREIDIPEEIKKKANEREIARREKNFIRADELRKAIESQGFRIEDTEKGPVVKKD